MTAFNIPAGWKLVPLEPTMEMRSNTGLHHIAAHAVYKAMLAKAPPVDAVPGEPVAAKVTEISNALAKTQWASEQQRSDWIAYSMSLVRELAGIAPAATAEPSDKS